MYIFAIIRIILGYIILKLNINNLLKIILIIISDSIDGSIPVLLGINKKNNVDNIEYQISDKIVDFINYVMLYIYINDNNLFSKNELYILVLLLIYQLIGNILMYIKSDIKILKYFPDIYKILILYLFFIKTYKINNILSILILIILIIFKIYQEYIKYYSYLNKDKENKYTFISYINEKIISITNFFT
jgi:hypothetical protein